MLLALAGAAAAAPAAPITSCPILPVSFDITDFHFNGEFGPVITENYSFNVSGNVGPSTTSCQAVSAGGDDKCETAFRDIEPTACANDDFSFSFVGSDTASFLLQVNYTVPNCGTWFGCKVFDASDIVCEAESHRPIGIYRPGQGNVTVHYENLKAPTSFTLSASNQECIIIN